MLANEPVRVDEMSREDAERVGAIAFFGDKYGDIVRVVEAGTDSVELCGGTHVRALGTIGPLQILSEASIGSNTRRIEAVTGEASLARLRVLERTVEEAADRLRTQPADLPLAIDRLIASERALEEQLRGLRSEQLRNEADALAASAASGYVVARRDGLEAGELRDLAIAVRNHRGVEAVGLAGVTGPERVALVVAARKGSGVDARAVAAPAASAVGGGSGGTPELATAGGRIISGIEEALTVLREAFGSSPDDTAPAAEDRS